MNKIPESRKMIYFVIICIVFIIVSISGTYAYFTAKKTIEGALTGETATVSFGLDVRKVTNIDQNGLIPMDDELAPYASATGCLDDHGNAVCQIYKISVTNTGNTNIYLDGYIELALVNEDEMRFTRVYYDGDNYCIKESCQCESSYCANEFDITNVKTGIAVSEEDALNREDDVNALFIKSDKENENDILKSKDTKNYYAMVWIHNVNEEQNDLQGIENVFSGKITFVSSQGSEVTATFE